MDAKPHSAHLVRFLLFVGLLLVNCLPLTWAQFWLQQPATQSGTPESSPSGPIILISARNKDGTPAQLSAQDLEIKINGKATAASEVRFLGRPPIRYCVLFDSSGSRRAIWEQQTHDATALMNLAQSGRDYGMLVGFSDQPFLDAQGTDPQKLVRALSKESARGGTAVYDAMVACSDEVSKTAARPELRVMFILSDGDDNSSHVSRDELQRTLPRAEMRVYAIGQKDTANPSEGAGRGIAALKQFAEKTGGQAYFPKAAADDAAAVADISSELGSVFSVTLSRALAGDLFYKLEFKCSQKNISLSAPQEYFVPLP
jgi:VWFA-related protein